MPWSSKRLVQQPLGALRPSPTSVRIAGVVAQLRTQTSRRGKMAFVILDDGKDQCEVAIFNETFDACRAHPARGCAAGRRSQGDAALR